MKKVFVTAGTDKIKQAVEQGRGNFPISEEEIGDNFHAEAITSNNIRSASIDGLIEKVNEFAQDEWGNKVQFSASGRYEGMDQTQYGGPYLLECDNELEVE